LGFLVQARSEERHQVVVHEDMLDDRAFTSTRFTTITFLRAWTNTSSNGGGSRGPLTGSFTRVHGRPVLGATTGFGSV
ncbi:hypothetical protein ACWD25_59825, partial [Streptomyces sp. NPDC002920]